MASASNGGDSLAANTAGGLRGIAEVVIRRWVVIVAIVLLSLIIGGVTAGSSSSSYVADSQILIDQPSLTVQGTNGLDTVQKLTDLMTTFTRLAVSDPVLQSVIQTTGSSMTVSDLRSHITTSYVLQSLVLTIRVSFPARSTASSVANAYIGQLRLAIDNLSAASPDPANRYNATVLQSPHVSLSGGHKARTIGLAFLLGLGFGLIAAFSLERSRPLPAATAGA